MGVLTWKQASADYEKKSAGSNTAGTTPPTSGMLSWKQAADEFDRYDEDGYKALGMQRMTQMQERYQAQKDMATGMERLHADDTVNDWLNRYNRVIQGITRSEQKRNGGFTHDADSVYGAEIDALLSGYDGIKNHSEIRQYYDSLTDLKNSLSAINESFSQFEDESAFDQYMAYWKDQEEKKNLDLDAYSREIAALEQQLDEYDAGIDWTDTNQRKKADKEIVRMQEEIDRRKQYLTQAQRVQKKDDFSAVANPESEKYDAAFDSKSGYVSTEQDSKLQRMLSQYSMGYDDLTYEYINNQNGIRDEIKHKASAYSKGETPFEEKGYDYMTEDEVGLYNYYYSMGGKASAEAYLDTIQDDLDDRKAAGIAEDIKGRTAAEMLFGVEAGLDQFKSGIKGVARAAIGDDSYVAPSAIQKASGLVREDLADDGFKLPAWLGGASLGQVGYDAITTTANMAPSIIGSVASNFIVPGSGAAVGSALLGGSAAGNAYQEALNEGYTVDQARGYGILSGASEIIMERLLGGISAYGGNALGKFFTQNMKNADTALKQIAKKIGGSMLSEFSEEYLQEVLTPVFQNLTLGTDNEVKLVSAEALYAGFLGAITGGVLEGPSAVARNATPAPSNATELANNATPELSNATAVGEKSTPGGVTEKSSAVDDKMSATEAVAKNATTTVGVSKMETVHMTEDLDSFARQFGTQAEAVKRNYLEGQDLQEYEVGFQTAYAMGLEGGKQEALASVPYLSQSQREIAFSLGRDAAAAQKAAAPKKAAMTAKMTTEEGTQDVTIAEVVDMDDTTMTFRLEDGRTVTDNDLDFEKGQELMAAAWELGMDVKSVNTIVTESAANTAADADQAAGIQQAHHYGQHGYTMEQLTKYGADAAALTDGQRKAAWEAGRQIYLKKSTAPAPVLQPTKASGVWFDAGGGNVRSFDDADLSGLSEAAVAGARTAKVLQKLGIGRNYYFYESYVNSKGDRVYKDAQGVERIAPNGWYDPDGSIHIDLNAGAEGKGLTMYTLSHELTHFVEKWSPKKYQALADFLVANYAKAGNVDVMVAEKQAELSAGRDSEVSYEDAYSEFIADSMEAMLSDGNVLEMLQELKKTDKSLFDKIKEFFDNLGKKIREIYKDLTPDSLEGQAVLQMKDQIDHIQQLFAEALADAGEQFQAATEMGLEVDEDTESVAPAVLYSERTWRESEYVQERNKAAKEIADAIGVSEKKAKDYIDSINSIARMIAEDRTRLDYFSSPGRSSFISNVEYGGSFDFSTLCKKRRLLTGTFTAIQKALPNTALTANEILEIRNRMKDAGLEVSCGLCYVEGSRANMGQFAKEFLRLYKQYYPDAWQPNMADVNTPDGIEWVRINHPECYEQYEYFWNHYGTLKAGDKNLFASQQKPKLYQLHTEYKGEILQKFKDDDNVEEKNLNGGIRLQSFSDFEIVHLIDTMQIIMDMSRVGLAGQAYTKVPDFAWALGDTGLKINLSLIAKGVDESGNLIFDDIEGMPIAEAMKLRDRYSANVGTILVAFNDAQLMAAMADDRVDFIIPFHRSQWKKSQYEAMGLPAKTKDYTFMQNEKFIKPQYHEYRGRMVKDKATNYMPNEYWDFSKSGRENAEAYLEMCARNNKRPKFYKLLQNNGDGSYSLKADGSTDGYWKLLIDFKMYDNDGNGSPQAPVRPEFNMAEATRMLDDYNGGHSNFPVAQGIVDSFVSEYKENHGDRMYSDRKKASGFKDYDITAAVYEIRNEKAERGHDLVKIGTMPTLYHELFGLDGDVYVSNSHLYQNMVSRTVAEAEGRFNLKDHADYHDLGEEKIINAIDQFQDPLLLMESLKDFNEPRLVALLAEKGNDGQNLIAVLELYSPIRAYGSPNMRSHVLMTIYEKNSLPDYIEKTVDKGRILHKKQGLHQLRQADLQLVGDVTEETLKKNVARFNKKVKEFKAQHNISYQDRASGTSNRDLLAGSFEELVRNPDELKFIQQYKENVALLNEQEQKLQEIRTEIRELTFGKGPKDPKRLEKLQEEAGKTANRIHIYDKKLLQLEAAKPLRDVLDREREKVRKATRQKGQEAMAEYREKRRDSAARKDARRKIRKTVMELDKLLNRGDKKKNVKSGMTSMVDSVLKLADALFMDEYTNRDMLRNGVGVELTDAEEKLFREAQQILQQAESGAAIEGMEFTSEVDAMNQLKKLDQKLSSKMAGLKDVFARERKRLYGTTVSDLLGKLADEYSRLSEAEDGAVRAAKDENIYAHLLQLQKDVGGTTVRDMTLGQMEAVADAFTMVLTTVRNANKMFAKNLQFDRETVAGMLVQEFQARKIPSKKIAVIAKNLTDAVGWNYEKLHYALERINSPTLTRLFGNLADSENITMRDVQEAKEFQEKMVEKYHYNDWDIDKKMDQTFLDNTGKEFHLTLGELMALYAYSRREGADKHIEVGGFTFGETALTDPEPATTYKLTPEQVAAISDLLTAEQKSFAEAMQKYLSETMGAKGNEVTMKLYGIEMFTEENYFPLHIAGEYKAKAQESQAKAEAGFQAMTNAGFTKARNTNATAPIVLEDFMGVWADHVNEMSRYHGAVPALEDIRRVMNYSVYSDAMQNSVSVTAAMTNAYGKQAVQYFDNLYREANSGAVTDRMDATSKKLLSLFRKNSVAYSASVVIQQSASIYRAKALIDGKYFGKHGFFTLTGGVLRILNRKKWNAAYAEMMKYAPGVTMAKEIGGFDTSTGSSIRSYLLDTDRGFRQSMKHGTLKQKAGAVMGVVDDNFIANLPNVADKLAWIEIWEACKRETVAKDPKMSTATEAFLQKVGQRFTEVIRATQVYDSMFSKSPMLKSRNLAVQYAVSFMNEPNTVINMAEQAVRDLGNKEFRKVGKTVGALATSIVATNLLKSIIYAMRDEDEDETFLEKYLSAVAGNLMSDVNVLNYIPIARDVWSIWEGYDVERSDMAIVADAIGAIQKLRKLNGEDVSRMTEEELEAWDKKVMDAQWRVAETLCPIAGVPLKNIRRDVLAAVNAVKIRKLDKGRESTELSIRHAIEEATGKADRSDRQKLYEALLADDQTYVQRLKAGYDDEAAYHTAIRKALREHDSRIWEAAIAWNQDNLAEYLRIGEMIAEEGHFEFSDIYAAIQSEAASMEQDDSDSGTRIKGRFTGEKFGVAIGQNNTSMADIIRKDLIDTKVANGKTREEAEESVRNSARTQLKELFGAGSITGAAAEKLLVRYGGYNQEEAADKVADWKFETEYGFTYSDRSDAYKNGEISQEELRSILMDVGGKTRDEADLQIQVYDWEAQGFEGATVSAVRNYNEYCAGTRVPKDVYLHIRKVANNTDNDVDASGKTIYYSAMRKIMAEIGAHYTLTSAQKYAIARSLGWSEKNIEKYKTWH